MPHERAAMALAVRPEGSPLGAWTRPVALSVPMCNFMPKCHSLPFLTSTPALVVDLVWTNLMGAHPTAAEAAPSASWQLIWISAKPTSTCSDFSNRAWSIPSATSCWWWLAVQSSHHEFGAGHLSRLAQRKFADSEIESLRTADLSGDDGLYQPIHRITTYATSALIKFI